MQDNLQNAFEITVVSSDIYAVECIYDHAVEYIKHHHKIQHVNIDIINDRNANEHGKFKGYIINLYWKIFNGPRTGQIFHTDYKITSLSCIKEFFRIKKQMGFKSREEYFDGQLTGTKCRLVVDLTKSGRNRVAFYYPFP